MKMNGMSLEASEAWYILAPYYKQPPCKSVMQNSTIDIQNRVLKSGTVIHLNLYYSIFFKKMQGNRATLKNILF
jgi:hypothetical protein